MFKSFTKLASPNAQSPGPEPQGRPAALQPTTAHPPSIRVNTPEQILIAHRNREQILLGHLGAPVEVPSNGSGGSGGSAPARVPEITKPTPVAARGHQLAIPSPLFALPTLSFTAEQVWICKIIEIF